MHIRPMVLDCVPEAARLYCACFAEPPWYEVFSSEDVEREMNDVLRWSDTAAAAAFVDGRLIGAAYGFSLRRKLDVLELVSMPPTSFYVSEIFVEPTMRGRGVANALVQDLLGRMTSGLSGVVRTSVHQPVILWMFTRMGWRIVVRQHVMSEKFVNGRAVMEPDERVILVGRIS